MTFEKHLRSVSRAASQRLGIFRKSWLVFRDRLVLGRCFRGFVLPVLEYCSAVWCSAADTHFKPLDRVANGASILSHRRSLAVLCMLYKIRCNPMHPLYGALPVPDVPVRVERYALFALRYIYEPPRCKTCGMIFLTLCSVASDFRALRAGPMPLCWPELLSRPPFFLLLYSLLSLCGLILDWGLRTHRGSIANTRSFFSNN